MIHYVLMKQYIIKKPINISLSEIKLFVYPYF